MGRKVRDYAGTRTETAGPDLTPPLPQNPYLTTKAIHSTYARVGEIIMFSGERGYQVGVGR